MEPILKEWEDFARSLGAVTAGMDTSGLRDHADLILRAVAADLERPQTDAQQEAKSVGDGPAPPARGPRSAATAHGSVRAEEGFSLEEMISEYRALRASVLRLWARGRPTPDAQAFEELMRFNEAIDQALADSMETFARTIDQMGAAKARHRMAALGTLSAGLGHDMANVLLTLRSCMQILSERGFTPATAPLVEGIHRAVEHLDGLSNGLRALAMDPEDSGAAPHSTRLPEWWSTAISPFTWALPAGVRLHAAGFAGDDPALPPVRIPEHALMQAVFNLVQNAAHALGQRNAANVGGKPAAEPIGNIWVTAKAGTAASRPASADAARAVQVTVRDDGPGMDARCLARCTEPFFTTKAKNKGTGLGLHLVRTAVERYGGELLIESEVGAGATFTLVLPVADAEDPA